MTGKYVIRQRDFSGGEVVEHAKRRDDEPAVRAGCRSLRNTRILSSGAVEQRPGRSALFQNTGPSREIRLDSETTIFLCFGDGTLSVRNSSGTLVAQAWGYDWDEDTAGNATVVLFNKDIVITFDGQAPKIVRWDGATGFTFLDWAATTTSAGRKLVPFVRFAAPGITMALSALTGSVTVTFSADVLDANHVGTRFRYYDKQIEITAVASPTSGTATISENLRQISSADFTADVTDQFAVGDILEGETSGCLRYVSEVGTPGNDDLTVIRLNAITGINGEIWIGPTGQAQLSTGNADPTTGAAITVWDEELMSDFRGWPRSVSVDQNRLIFSDFPGMPEAIAWSASGDHTDFAVGLADDADPADAICEFAPKKARVFHVMDGADEFVFTDLGLYYIPISESNPLRPGSVAFRRIPGAPASSVRPVSTAQGLVYANKSNNRVLAIVGTGQTAQPYLVRPASDLQSHLFTDITCIAIEEGGGDPPDELVYVVNGDGTVVVGRYQVGKDWAGWQPWDGEGDVRWISTTAGNAAVFSTEYLAGWLAERVDADRYLDAAVDYDAIPAALGTGAQSDILLHDDQGTAIGDMTSTGGLAAAFDGTTSQLQAASATKSVSTTGAVGKTFGQPMRIAKAEIYPSSNNGFTDQANVTITLRAKQGAAPSNYASEGTQLATTGSIADTTSMQTLTSNDTTTEWDHAWALLTISSGVTIVAELRLYSPVASHGSGELWFLASDTLFAMDGLRNIGERSTDANGEVTLEEGDVAFTDETFGHVFGDVIVEPFVPHVGPGQSVGQALRKRPITDMAIAVQNSTGFKVQKWNSVEQAWAELKARAPYIVNDDEGDAPPLREEVWQPGNIGTEHDPRVRVVKDYPGPVRVLEITLEVGA